MKKTAYLLLTVAVLLLAGCADNPNHPEIASGALDSSEPYVLQFDPGDRSQASNQNFWETQDVYYYCNVDNVIYFCPRGGDTFRPLCGKPNCQHNDENCNAWCDGLCFGYYNGALYTAGNSRGTRSGEEIIKMNLDGTDHKVVTTLDDSRLKDRTVMAEFHHGRLFVMSYADDLDQPQGKQLDELFAVDLADGFVHELATDYLSGARLPIVTNFYKDKLYGMEYDNDCPVNSKLVEIDTATGEGRVLLSDHIDGLYATDVTLYYYVSDPGNIGVQGQTNVGFWEYDLQSGTVKDCGNPCPNVRSARYDEDYIYAMSFPVDEEQRLDKVLYFISRDYQLVDQVELRGGLFVARVASDRLFFGSITTGCITCYLDKSQIGSHNLTLIPVETVR